MLPNSFYEATMYTDTKTRQGHHTHKILQTNIPVHILQHRYKNLQQNFSKRNSTIH